MTTTTETDFRIHAIREDELKDVLTSGVDVSGNPLEHLTASGGEPLRCCLRDAELGEAVILFGYEPPIPSSPYREIGPVFTHASWCGGPAATGTYPSAWRGRPQVLRAYDRRGWIHPLTRAHDGSEPETIIAEMFDSPDVVQIHSRNVAYGCYMFAITRSHSS